MTVSFSAVPQFGALSRTQQNDADYLLDRLRIVPEDSDYKSMIEGVASGWGDTYRSRASAEEQERILETMLNTLHDEAANDDGLFALGHIRSFVKALAETPDYQPSSDFWQALVGLAKTKLDDSATAISEHILTLVEDGQLHDATAYVPDADDTYPDDGFGMSFFA